MEDNVPVVTMYERNFKKKEELPLSRPFILPDNFTPIVNEAIQSKELVGKSRRKFITAIASAIFQKKLSNKKEEYEYKLLLIWCFRNGHFWYLKMKEKV
jgi:hypothetical protein